MNEHGFLVRSGVGPVAVRPAQLGHAVQRRTAHQPLRRLSREPMRRYPITKKRLETKHRGLGQATARIPTLALPCRASYLPNPTQILIARQALRFGVAMLPNLGVALGGNRRPGVAGLEGLITCTPVIAPIAHHYRCSPNTEKAITYLQLAGQQAVQRSAHTEAISHHTAALDLLLTCPKTPERAAQELTLRLAVGPALMVAQGFATPAVEQHYTRARALCDQLGDAPQRFPVLWGLWQFHAVRGEMRTAQALAEEGLQLAEQTNEDGLLPQAHYAVGATFLWRGDFVRAQGVLEQGVALYQPQHYALTPLYAGYNPQVASLTHLARVLWVLGYPEQALTQLREALHLAQGARSLL
jgi:hypothetical protein